MFPTGPRSLLSLCATDHSALTQVLTRIYYYQVCSEPPPPSRLFLRDLFPVTAETSEKKEPSCVDTGGKSSRKRVKSAFTASEESKRHVTVTG